VPNTMERFKGKTFNQYKDTLTIAINDTYHSTNFCVIFIAYTPIKFPTGAAGSITNLADCRFDTPLSDNIGQRNSN
jgi:acyl-coenzyme A synthetase/AMP-(fatty) acid ligase